METAAQAGAPSNSQPTQAAIPQGFQQYVAPPQQVLYGPPIQGVPQTQSPNTPGIPGANVGQPQSTTPQIEAWKNYQAYLAAQQPAQQVQQGQQYRPMVMTQLPNGQYVYMPMQQPQAGQPQQFAQNLQAQNQFGQPTQPVQTYQLELDANGVAAFAGLLESNGKKAEASRIKTQFNLAQSSGFDIVTHRNVTVGHVLWTVVAGVGLIVVWEGIRYVLKDKVALPGLIKYSTATKR